MITKKAIKNANDFVRKEQDVMSSMMGDKPAIPAEMKRFNAYMSNNADTSNRACEVLTKGLDKKAFPVGSSED